MNVVTSNGQSHDRDGIEKMCSNKHRYATKKSAKAALVYRNKERKKNGEQLLRPYKCPYCNGYHLTSTERNSAKA